MIDEFRNRDLVAVISEIDNVRPDLAARLVKILCRDFSFHYGSSLTIGDPRDGRIEQTWSCWNCDWEVHSVTEVKGKSR